MKRIAFHFFSIAAALVFVASPAAHAQKIRVGYWTSGVSLGFGTTMENMKILEKQGLDVEYIKFSDVNAPTRAVVSGAIDVAFGTSAAGALNIAADGVPIKIFLATQIAEVRFAVLESSPIKSLAEFRGKKIGMSPPGSATHAIAVALLEGNYGLKPADYSVVPGNEPVLAQFLAQGEVQASALRGTTVAQISDDVKLRILGRVEKTHQEQCLPRNRHGDRAHRVSREESGSNGEVRARHEGNDRLGREKPGSRGRDPAEVRQHEGRRRQSIREPMERDLRDEHGTGGRRDDEENGRDLPQRGIDQGQRPRLGVRHRTLREGEAPLRQVTGDE